MIIQTGMRTDIPAFLLGLFAVLLRRHKQSIFDLTQRFLSASCVFGDVHAAAENGFDFGANSAVRALRVREATEAFPHQGTVPPSFPSRFPGNNSRYQAIVGKLSSDSLYR